MPQNADLRYYRFVMFADPRMGKASLSWRLKCCLEAAGHTVFWFTPQLQPHAFARAGVVRSYMVRAFLTNQRPDCVLLADGLVPDYPDDLSRAASAVVGVLVGTGRAESVAEAILKANWSPDFALTCGNGALEALTSKGFSSRAYELGPLPDAAYLAARLANPASRPLGILCLQDATPERCAALRALKDEPGMASSPVRCYGAGWPDSWTADAAGPVPLYVLKRSHTVVVFGDGDDAPDDHALGLALSSGARGLALGSTPRESAWGEKLEACPSLEAFVEAGVDSMRDARAGRQSDSCASPVAVLDDDVQSFLGALRDDFAASGLMAGCPQPRTVACVLGYVGKNNYGDEHILATVERRIRLRVPGSTVVAISDDPVHTLEHRGMYAITMKDKHVLDETVRHCAATLVIAGLLFDQGVRWGMGKSELISCMDHSTIYGIAALATLSALNDAKMVLYGVGAGPLELTDAKRLVRLMGTLNATFIARDEDTAALIRRAGVDEEHLMAKADAAFLGVTPRTDFVDAWLSENEIDPDRDQILALSLRAYETVAADFPRRVARALDASIARYPRLRPVLCVLDPKDKAVAESVLSAMDAPERARIMDSGNDIDAISDLLSRSHAGLSMRYHCALVLMRSGKPCAGISYLPKVGSLFVDTGCADLLMTASATSEEMAGKIALMMDAYDDLLGRVREGVEKLTALSTQSEEYLIDQIVRHGAGKSFALAREIYPQTLAASERLRDGAQATLEEKVDAEKRRLSEERRAFSARSMRIGRAVGRVARRFTGR